MSQYVVSRQHSWPDGELYIEIETGGPDMTSPGMIAMVGQYDDPREAAQSAVDARSTWRADDPDEEILVSIGTTLGGWASHCPEDMPDEEILDWGEKLWKKMEAEMEHCDWCGDPLEVGRGGKARYYFPVDDPDLGKFCGEACSEKAMEESRLANEEVLIEHEDYWSWWDAEARDWVEEPGLATPYFRGDIPDPLPPHGFVVPLEEALVSHESITQED